MVDVSVVIPARNAEHLLDECLASIVRSAPREIIVVDGLSSDRTVEIARAYGARVLSDEGRGLPAARMIGTQAASAERVALIDADVVLPEGALASLFEEFVEGGYAGLQAGLASVSGPGYWGQALVDHHRTGRSKNWFGVVATIFDRGELLEHGFDVQFLSGEDIELRWRLERAGAKLGVSRRTIVTHRFDDTFDFARGQWLADGRGFGRMIGKHGWRSAWLVGLPFAAGVRGLALSIARAKPRWIPYYVCYIVFNYVGLLGVFGPRARRAEVGRA
jgi:glycosyltransferase involved in cell wall biosynthesis